MSKRITPVPKGYHTATPQLVVRGAEQAIAYYVDVFGATVLSQHLTEDGLAVLQAELKIGNSIIRIMDEMPTFGIFSPIEFGGTSVGVHLYMPNVDDVWERAMVAGAGVLMPLAETAWGEYYGKFVDMFGHVWSVSRRISKKAKSVKSSKETDVTVTADTFSVHEPLADKVELTTEQAMTAHTENLDENVAA